MTKRKKTKSEPVVTHFLVVEKGVRLYEALVNGSNDVLFSKDEVTMYLDDYTDSIDNLEIYELEYVRKFAPEHKGITLVEVED